MLLTGVVALVAPTGWSLGRDALLKRRLLTLQDTWRKSMSPVLDLEASSRQAPLHTHSLPLPAAPWELTPCQTSAGVRLTLSASSLAAISLTLTSDPERDFAHPDFSQLFCARGEDDVLFPLLTPATRDALIALATSPVASLETLELSHGSLRITWLIPARCIHHDGLPRLLHAAMQVARALRAPALCELPRALAAHARATPSAARARALSMLFARFPGSRAACDALDILLELDDSPLLLEVALTAPALLPTQLMREELLLWGMRHAREASRRGAALDAALDLLPPDTARLHINLEHLAIHEPELTLRARAQTCALSLPHPTPIDAACVMLATQRLLKHTRTLSAVTRQKLELALLHTHAKPGRDTYLRLAQKSPDKILRYSSLRALVAHSPAHPDTLRLLATARPTRHEAATAIPTRATDLLHDFILDDELGVQAKIQAACALTRVGRSACALASFQVVLTGLQGATLSSACLALAQAVDAAWSRGLLRAHFARFDLAAKRETLERLRHTSAQPLSLELRQHLEKLALLALQDARREVFLSAAALIAQRGSASMVPALEALRLREGARPRSSERRQAIKRALSGVYERERADGALTLIDPAQCSGQLSLAQPAGRLALTEAP